MVAKYTPRLCRASDSGSRNQIKLNSKLHLMKVYKQANLFEQSGGGNSEIIQPEKHTGSQPA